MHTLGRGRTHVKGSRVEIWSDLSGLPLAAKNFVANSSRKEVQTVISDAQTQSYLYIFWN